MPTKKGGEGTSAAAAKSSESSPISELLEGPKTRTTLLISVGLDRMVEVCAAVERRQKSEIVNEALAAYLENKPELHSL
jgi:hypothetical protein